MEIPSDQELINNPLEVYWGLLLSEAKLEYFAGVTEVYRVLMNLEDSDAADALLDAGTRLSDSFLNDFNPARPGALVKFDGFALMPVAFDGEEKITIIAKGAGIEGAPFVPLELYSFSLDED